MFTQHPKECLLEAKQIPIHVAGLSRKITFEDMITPLDFQKAKHVIKRP